MYKTIHTTDYGTSINYENKIITFLSNISYEIYLVQYPIIYLFQYININTIAKNVLIVIITFVISYILHISINIKKEEKLKIIKYILRIIILLISLFGLYKYCISKDYTHEMEQLKKDLEKNQQIIEYRQKEYEQLLKQEQDDWTNLLNNLENEEQGLKDIISNLHIIGIGDSVMLGAVNELYNTFKNGYFDASISRTAWVAKGILDDLESKNIVSDTVLFNLGANGDCTLECKIKIMDSCKDKHVFWINVTNSDDVNKSLLELSTMYSNLHIIDWNSFSKGHKEYFAADNIHLTQIGKVEYTKYIYDSIYNVYLEEYNKKKEEIINKHNEELKNKISFYGNDLLLNIYDYIKDDYKDARITINSEYTYDLIKKDIINDINNELINYKVVIALDSAISLNAFEYKEIMDLFKNNEIYILITNEYAQNELLKINYENVHIINFYNEIIENDDYLLIDKIHLSKKGNEKLKDILITNLKEKPVSN